MATYQFSALSDGQAISFNPNADALNFDQSVIAAADIRVATEGANTRITVVEGPHAGKDVLLLNTSMLQFNTVNIRFANGSVLLIGDNSTSTAGDNSPNARTGTGGRDQLNGLGAADTLNGGGGDDVYFVSTGDVVNDSSGVDTVYSDVSWTFAIGNRLENLTYIGTAAGATLTGNELGNVITGNDLAQASINGRAGNDTMFGLGGNDTFDMSTGGAASYGDDVIDGGAGVDTIDFGANARSGIRVDLRAGTIVGGGDAGAGSVAVSNVENVVGGAFADLMVGNASANFFFGGEGDDTLDGAAGADRLEGGAGADEYVFSIAPGTANADTIVGFASGADRIVLDGAVHANLGANGRFASGDERFHTGAAAAEADDRVIYNPSTGQLWYDADGLGGAGAQLIATLQGGSSPVATDFWVSGSSASGMHLVGGPENDTLVGGPGNDTLEGRGGQDDLTGGGGADRFVFTETPRAFNNDYVRDFAPGSDEIALDNRAFVNLGAAGDFAAGDGRFRVVDASSNWGAVDADDRLLYAKFSEGASLLYDPDGTGEAPAREIASFFGQPDLSASDFTVFGTGYPATPAGTSGNDSLVGSDARDTIDGGGGNDTIEGWDGNDILIGGDGNDRLSGGLNNDSLSGGAGNDTLETDGLDGWDRHREDVDTLNGGLGDDLYVLARYVGPDDVVLIDEGGTDTVFATGGSFALGAGIENLTLGFDWTSDGSTLGFGNELDNVITGFPEWWVWNFLYGLAGDDTLIGGAAPNLLDGGEGDDSLVGAGRADTLEGGAGNDTLDASNSGGMGSGAQLNGGAGNDVLLGSMDGDSIAGGDGDDWLEGGANSWMRIDEIAGGAGRDSFVFRAAPTEDAHANVNDFASGVDKLVFDAQGFTALGRDGNFSVNDERFHAGAAAAESDDRIVWNASTGELWFDSDGSGSAAARLIADLGVGTTVVATDISVLNGTPAGETQSGTDGDDTLTGTFGNDTIDGRGGNDSIDGLEGADLLIGGAGNDTLQAGHNNAQNDGTIDTLDGGLGDDVYYVSGDGSGNNDVILADPGGVDTVVARTSWTLGAGLDNLDLNDFFGSSIDGTGNELDNVIRGGSEGGILRGMGGNDTLIARQVQNSTLLFGGDGNDTLQQHRFGDLFGEAGDDVLLAYGAASELSGGAGADHFVFNSTGSQNTIADFASGADKLRLDATNMTALGTTGNFTANDERFHSGASAAEADDRVIWNAATGEVWYDADGSGSVDAQLITMLQPGAALVATDIVVDNGTPPGQTITGTVGNDSLTGTAGDDTISGLGGNDSIWGLGGDDSLNGGDDADLLDGGDGDDTLVSGNSNGGVSSLYGGKGNDSMTGGTGDELFYPGDGNDVVATGGGDNSVFIEGPEAPTYGSDTLIGGTGLDALHLWSSSSAIAVDMRTGVLSGGAAGGGGRIQFSNFEYFDLRGSVPVLFIAADTAINVSGGDASDTLIGGAGADSLFGGDGNDSITGGGGSDFLDGGHLGQDDFFFTVAPDGSNVDSIWSFDSGGDRLHFDLSVFTQLGAPGAFTADDERFHIGTAAHDASDRLIYDGRNLWYDPDGTGSQAAQAVATLLAASDNTPSDRLLATDIVVYGTSGQSITGTAGNDSLTGTDGNDTLDGLGGNDTLNGGLGDDKYIAQAGDVIQDSGGVDTLETPSAWNLTGSTLDNVTLTGTASVGIVFNNLDNRIIGNSANNSLEGRGGSDTIEGAGGNDYFKMHSGGLTSFGFDVIDGGAGIDTVDHDMAQSALTVDLAAGTVSGGDAGGGGGMTLANIESFEGGNFNDRLSGSAANNQLFGNAGNDTLIGLAGHDSLVGGDGNDWLEGGSGFDTLVGGAGNDSFVFTSTSGRITDFAPNADQLVFENAVFAGLGAPSDWAAGDGRFRSAAGATAAADADDRLIYNQTNGNLYYDSDGAGGAASQLVTTLANLPGLTAADISVI